MTDLQYAALLVAALGPDQPRVSFEWVSDTEIRVERLSILDDDTRMTIKFNLFEPRMRVPS